MPLPSVARSILRKIHSLTGILPVGLLLLEHFFTNYFAMFGAEAFAEKVLFVTSLPYLILLEIGLIGVPIAFHPIHAMLERWDRIGLADAASTFNYPLAFASQL